MVTNPSNWAALVLSAVRDRFIVMGATQWGTFVMVPGISLIVFFTLSSLMGTIEEHPLLSQNPFT